MKSKLTLLLLACVVLVGATMTGLSISGIQGAAIGRMAYDGGLFGKWSAANTSTTKKFLTETGTGTAGAAPTWGTLSVGDVSGAGTVTSFSSGNLSPLFTTSVANSTTTPALSFSLSNAAQNAVLAGPTSGTGAPTYRALVAADIPSLSYVTSVGMTVPSWLAVTGSPVTSSGTLAVTAATGQTANQVLATPNGSTGAVSLRALVAGDIPAPAGDLSGTYASTTVSKVQNVAVKSGTPNNSDVLTYITANSRWEPTAWSTGLPAAGSAGRMPYDNGSGYSLTAAPTTGQMIYANGTTPTWSNVIKNDGSGITVLSGATGTVALTVNGAASNTAPPLDVLNPAATTSVRVTSTATSCFNIFRTSVTPTAGTTIGTLSFAGITTGSTYTQGGIQSYIANEGWDSTHAGTDWVLQLCAPGSTSLTTRIRGYADGDVNLYGSGSEGATSATTGFVFIPTSNGAPTGGSARTLTGAAGIRLDRSKNIIYSSVAGGTPTPVTTQGQPYLNTSDLASTGSSTASTLGSTTDIAFIDTSAGGQYTLTLPSATTRGARPIKVRRLNGGIANVVIQRAGSDTIEGTTTMTLTSTSTVELIPHGTDWVTLSRSAN